MSDFCRATEIPFLSWLLRPFPVCLLSKTFFLGFLEATVAGFLIETEVLPPNSENTRWQLLGGGVWGREHPTSSPPCAPGRRNRTGINQHEITTVIRAVYHM